MKLQQEHLKQVLEKMLQWKSMKKQECKMQLLKKSWIGSEMKIHNLRSSWTPSSNGDDANVIEKIMIKINNNLLLLKLKYEKGRKGKYAIWWNKV